MVNERRQPVFCGLICHGQSGDKSDLGNFLGFTYLRLLTPPIGFNRSKAGKQ